MTAIQPNKRVVQGNYKAYSEILSCLFTRERYNLMDIHATTSNI
jgi:hypothetical protein